MPRRAVCALAPIVAALGACAPGPLDDSAWPEPRPLGRDLDAPRPPRADLSPEAPAPTAAASALPPYEEPAGPLTLRDALAAALRGSPELAATAYEVRAREAESLQAGRRPNPELAFEIEDFGGTGALAGFDAAQMTLALSQLVELGGKRVGRRRVAAQEARAAGWEYEIRRVDILSRTAADFITLLAAERHRVIAMDTAALARRVYDAVGERVDAGKISPVERAKARVELTRARLVRERAERAVAAGRVRLASNWGSAEPQFTRLTGDLDRAETPPPLQSLLARVEQTPDIARWTAEAARRQAEIELALARRVPDLTVTGGVRYVELIDETAFVAGLSLPLPVFDRNQGGVQAARLRALGGDRSAEAARVRVRAALTAAHQRLDAAFVEVEMTRDEILPSAELAFEAAEEAFRQGKIGALDLLDAERTLFDARRQLVDALRTYHLAVVASERLIGAPLGGEDHTTGDRR